MAADSPLPRYYSYVKSNRLSKFSISFLHCCLAVPLSTAKNGPALIPPGPVLPLTGSHGGNPFDPENFHPHQVYLISTRRVCLNRARYAPRVRHRFLPCRSTTAADFFSGQDTAYSCAEATSGSSRQLSLISTAVGVVQLARATTIAFCLTPDKV